MTTHPFASPAIQPSTSFTSRLLKHWFVIFIVVYGAWVLTPFLAPLFMQMGWEGPGRAIYLFYSFFCHQLPERSLFLFGPRSMYTLEQIQSAWQNTANPLILRQFIGNADMGWKVAWSDRMISFYTSLWLFAAAWWPVRRKAKPISLPVFLLLLLPMVLDGGTHALSDFSGIGQGFRDSNEWLAALTGSVFPAWFYAGDALGSFNSWARLITGVLAGFALAWLAFPYLLRSQDLNSELTRYDYGAVLEQIKKQNPDTTG